MARHDTKDDAGLTDFIPFLKQITVTKINYNFSFLYIVFGFTGKTILNCVLASQTRE